MKSQLQWSARWKVYFFASFTNDFQSIKASTKPDQHLSAAEARLLIMKPKFEEA
jgi:hypothetical protein